MSERFITFLWGQAKGQRQLFRILRATGVEVRYEQTLRDVDLTNCSLVVVDYDSLDGSAPDELARIEALSTRPAVLVLTSSDESEAHGEILSYDSLTNLFAKNKSFEYTELIVAVQKIISNNIFGLERYVVWGVMPESQTVDSMAGKESALEEFTEYMTEIGVNRRLVELARGVADEFLMNAIYNVKLKKEEAGREGPNDKLLFRYACDGRNLAFSVEDKEGRFERAPLLAFIRESFKHRGELSGVESMDDDGQVANLSLYTAFRSLNHLIINVSPGNRTELIGAMDISGSYRDFVLRPKALHLFYEAN